RPPPPSPTPFPYTTLFRSASRTRGRIGSAHPSLEVAVGERRAPGRAGPGECRVGAVSVAPRHIRRRAAPPPRLPGPDWLGHLLRSEEHTSELQSRRDLVCR